MISDLINQEQAITLVLLARELCRNEVSANLKLSPSSEINLKDMSLDQCVELANLLLHENAKSYACRYKCNVLPLKVDYSNVSHVAITCILEPDLLQYYKSLQYYDFQSNVHDGYKTSVAKKFVDFMLDLTLRKSTVDVIWGIPPLKKRG